MINSYYDGIRLRKGRSIAGIPQDTQAMAALRVLRTNCRNEQEFAEQVEMLGLVSYLDN